MESLDLASAPMILPLSVAARNTHHREVLPVATVGKPSVPAARLVAVVDRSAAGLIQWNHSTRAEFESSNDE
ncbi:hypothetical protein KH389_07295 [Pseudomonas qingdaonensis]|uniref:Uncharacterized protein n=1 Tax=Pseudomonas qingdaonensis TaxID=2056231 RepID=A0ABX8DX74_9PSED|nr:hypothetical protein [Pseudomonas qingdaonensis]QVL20378.1 hypothetical protein KH389_07295 [Pseudomonas qingdaonensis]